MCTNMIANWLNLFGSGWDRTINCVLLAQHFRAKTILPIV